MIRNDGEEGRTMIRKMMAVVAITAAGLGFAGSAGAVQLGHGAPKTGRCVFVLTPGVVPHAPIKLPASVAYIPEMVSFMLADGYKLSCSISS